MRPAPDRDGAIGKRAVFLSRIDLLGLDLATVAPVVAEGKGVLEDLAGLDLLGDLQDALIKPLVGVVDVRIPDCPAICELEAVKVGEVPAGKGRVDRLRKVSERRTRFYDEDPTRR